MESDLAAGINKMLAGRVYKAGEVRAPSQKRALLVNRGDSNDSKDKNKDVRICLRGFLPLKAS